MFVRRHDAGRAWCTTSSRTQHLQRMKQSPIVDALFIGFLIGIVIYSVVAQTWGFLTLIPLYLIYRLLKKPKGDKDA
jgi:hypothetical protein